MNIAELKVIYGTCRRFIQSSIDQYLYAYTPAKSRFVIKDSPFVPAEKIYENEWVEEYDNCLILKDIYITLDKNTITDNTDSIKKTKHFSAIQTAVEKKRVLGALQYLSVLSENATPDKVHEHPCICWQTARILPHIIWGLQAVYHQCLRLHLKPGDCSLLLTQKKNSADMNSLKKLCELPAAIFNIINTGETKTVHQFKRLLIWKSLADTKKSLIPTDIKQQFCTDMLAGFNLKPPPPTQQVKKVTLVLRKDYYPIMHSDKLKIIYRKIANEDAFVDALNKHLLAIGVELQVVDLSQLSMKDQLNLIISSDVLMGVHGAALAHSIFLPVNAGVFEIIPSTLQQHHFLTYYSIAINNRLFYKRWFSPNPLRNQCSTAYREKKQSRTLPDMPKNDLTTLPTKPIAKKLLSLIDIINNANQ